MSRWPMVVARRQATNARDVARCRKVAPRRAVAPRRGVTLIEILIVIVILLLLVSVAVPLVRFNFEDKKVRETARLMNAFFAGAKAQAAEKNRQVAVWLERTPGNLNQCISVYQAEVPPPYSGDMIDARAYVRLNHNYPAGSQWEIIFDGPPACQMLTHTRSLVALNETFLIRFSYKGTVFVARRLALAANQPPQQDVFIIESDLGQLPLPGCWLPYDQTSPGIYNFADPNAGWGVPANPTPGAPATSATPPFDANDFPVGLPFQIYFSPKRTGAQPLDLPNDVAIDLTWSGFGASGTEFDSWNGPAPVPLDSGPVVVVFTPGGQVERVFFNNGSFVTPTRTLHFLIARPETIQPLDALTASPPTNPRIGANLNLENQSHLWISINPQNAAVTTAENYYDPMSYTVDVCRTFARSGQAKGGG